jgi:hypothetical protein
LNRGHGREPKLVNIRYRHWTGILFPLSFFLFGRKESFDHVHAEPDAEKNVHRGRDIKRGKMARRSTIANLSSGAATGHKALSFCSKTSAFFLLCTGVKAAGDLEMKYVKY